MRKFIIFTEPHITDPLLCCPVVELLPNGEQRQFSTADELYKAANEIHRRQAQLQRIEDSPLRAMIVFHKDDEEVHLVKKPIE